MTPINIQSINNYTGFVNFRDFTNLKPTDITAGSQNILIEDGAKLSGRGGSSFLGAEGTVGTQTNTYWTLAHRIHSKYDKFVNSAGLPVPIRMYYNGTTAVGDVLQVYLPEYVAGVAQLTKRWYTASQFTTPSSPLISTHRYYFAEWWDGVELVPNLVFCAGTNKIRSWTASFAPVTAVGATTITTNAGTTWASLGFRNAAAGGSDTVIINGVAYVTNGNFSTNIITVPLGTAGVSVNDIAFANIVTFTTSDDTIFDVCSMVNNQVYYIDWRQRNVLVSWNRNQNMSRGITTYSGTSGLDDAVFGGTFTGTGVETYQITIDSTTPAINNTVFSGIGSNDFSIGVSGFTGTAGQTYTYKFTVVADALLALTAVSTFTIGETIIGGTSNAVATVITGGSNAISIRVISGTFVNGENITGQISGNIHVCNGTDNTVGAYSYSKDGTLVFSASIIGAYASQNDGLFWGWTIFGGHIVGDSWTITIRKAKADTFSWSVNGVNKASLVPITGSAQTLQNGITVEFVQTTGHALSDRWTMTANPKIQYGYRNFTFSTPKRLPGEGFKILLDSNGWTMTPQEKSMYINGSAGEYYQVQTQLSSSLTDETLTVERLKTEPQFKALYPYLMAYMENYIATIIQEKSFNILGRQDFIELPQMRTLSDEVRVNFETADWEDADIVYGKTKTFFVLPKEGIVIVYDNFMKYFHAPMTFGRRVASISFIDGLICGHSYERNETYELFTDDLNDLGLYPIETRIVFPYFDDGERFQQKSVKAIAMDGYMIGDPEIQWTINLGVGGCDGIITNIVDPITCLPIDTASLGKSSLGFHGLGNSPADVIPHFKYGKTFAEKKYYLKNIELYSNNINQRWSIVSIGTSSEVGTLNNNNMFNITN